MTHVRYIVGAAVRELLALPAGSVDLVFTSPPFLGARDYLPGDDPNKGQEIGQETNPHEFVAALLDVVEAAAHALSPHGSLVLELGDAMAGSGGAGGDYYNADGWRADQPKPAGSAKLARQQDMVKGRSRNGEPVPRQIRGERAKAARSAARQDPETGRRPHVPAMRSTGEGWPEDKSLAMTPELLRIAMAYGEQPFTGRPTPRWRVRNVVRWCKPNPSVGDEGDKFRRAVNDVLVATMSPTRYWDKLLARGPSRAKDAPVGATAPLYDWLELPTGSYPGAHHATFPLEFVAPFIDTMCPQQVCTTCGEPQRRLVRVTDEYAASRPGGDMYARQTGTNDRTTGRNGDKSLRLSAEYEHVGWTDCGHGTWRRGVVCDPFAGTGTTLAVALAKGRDAIGIDLDRSNAVLAVDRIGPMFLTIEEGHHDAAAAAH